MTAARKISSTLEDAGLGWEVLSHDDLLGGAITWLRVVPAASHLASAMIAKSLVIEETGVVARLRVGNPSHEPILLPADLVVDGGKQARVVERSVILPARSIVDVAVRCVEQGRWSPKDPRTATSFAVATPASTSSREHLVRLKQRTMQAHERYELDQGEVWNHVASELIRTKTSSTTQSYTAFLSVRAQRVAEARRLDIQPPAPANGLALVRANGSVWVEVFPTREAMGSVVDAVVADAIDDNSGGEVRAASVARARADAAMRAIEQSPLAALAAPPETVGECYVFDGSETSGFALFHSGRLAHLVASVWR